MKCPHCGKEIPVEVLASALGQIQTEKRNAARRANIEKGRAAAAKTYTPERRAEAARKAWEKRRKSLA